MARFGNIGKQYLNDSGNPLANGLLYFFETGTTTPKNTYADAGLTIANTNPVVLSASGRQPNIFFDGLAKVMLTDSNVIQIETRDPEGTQPEGNFLGWDTTENYDAGGIVIGSDGAYYRSLGNSNKGNDPTSNPALWEEFEFMGVYNANITYAQNVIVKTSTGLLWRSKVSNNTGNDPVTSRAQWAPVVESIGRQTIYVPAGAMIPRITSGAKVNSIELATNKVMVNSLDFDSSVDEFAQFSVKMPESWDAGALQAQFMWSHPTTAGNFGVRFFIQAKAHADGDALDAAFGTAVGATADTGGTTDDIYVTAETGNITVANTPAKSEFVTFQIYRDVSDAGDTLAVDARLMGVSIFYTTDKAIDS